MPSIPFSPPKSIKVLRDSNLFLKRVTWPTGSVDMTATSNAEFAKRMMLLARSAEHFRPTATYDPDGDCIEFLAKAEPFFAERVDDLVTVYYSQESGEVIGSLLKGVSAFCSKCWNGCPASR